MKKSLVFLCAMLLVLGVAVKAKATPVLFDDFDDSTLDPAWSVTFENAKNWAFSETGTTLAVTDIDPTVVNSGGSWAKVILSQSFVPLGDFHVDFNFSWNSAGSNNAMQAALIKIYNDTESIVTASVGHYDAWIGWPGKTLGKVGGVGMGKYDRWPLGFAGNAEVDIDRVGDSVEIQWNETPLIAGNSGVSINRIDIEFWYYAYSGAGGTSFFGTESVDLVRIEGSPVPEPATMLLLGTGLIGLAGFRRKSKRS